MTEEEKKEKKKISAKKWRDKNKEYIKSKNKEYNKQYYVKNKVCKEKNILSEEEIKEKKRISNKKWRDKNKEYFIEYKNKNIDKITEYQKEYQLLNKETLSRKRIIRKKEKYSSDTNYKIKSQIRALIYKIFKRNGVSKNSKTVEILGCSFEEFKLYLESKFESWMTWENKGLYNGDFNYGWDIDHIIPISSAETEEDIIRLNHYTNLQPLCSKINRDIKKDILNYEMA